jgi:molybdopterin-guanine dinucleotide biosynthesis protein A
VTAAILAGGEGARVGGQDKGLLPLAGENLIARVSSAMRAQAGTLLVCANRHEETYAAFGAVVGDALPDIADLWPASQPRWPPVRLRGC